LSIRNSLLLVMMSVLSLAMAQLRGAAPLVARAFARVYLKAGFPATARGPECRAPSCAGRTTAGHIAGDGSNLKETRFWR
jgi:hypothetical protein